MIVTEKAKRPASEKSECFYCQVPIGGEHKSDCVLINKQVLVRATIEYEIEVPASWDKDNIEFHRNEGSWCAGNMIEELQKLNSSDGCLCSITKFEYVEDRSGAFLDE